jgi:tetratricopeptide (TPR) repeat protein
MLAGCGRSPSSYVQKGNGLFAQGKYEDAALNYRKAAQLRPEMGEAWFRLGLARVREGRDNEAYDAFNQAIQKTPSLTDAKIALADLAMRDYFADPRRPPKFYNQLRTLLPELLAKDPKCFDCLRIQGYLQLVDRQPAEALASFRKADGIRPMQNETVRGMVIAFSQNKQPEEAEKLALSLIAKDKTYGQIYDDLYALYQSEGRPGDAERVFQTKVANNPSVAAYRMQLAAHYYNIKKESEFEATLRPMKEDRKTFPGGSLEVARFYMRLAKWPEAKAILDETARQDKANRQTALDLELQALVAQGHNDEALRLADQVMKEFPADKGARFLQVSLWVDSKDASKASAALKELETMRTERSGQPLFWQAMGQAQLNLKDVKKAEASFKQAAAIGADFKQPRISLAELNLADGRPNDALRYADEAISIDPLDGHARMLRANALMSSNRLMEASRELNTLVKAAPQFEDAQLQLGLVDLSEKHYTDAEAIFRRFYHSGNKDLRALTGLAQIYMIQRNPHGATDLLNSDLKQSSDPNGVRRLLARTDLAINQPDAAIQQYNEILKTQPNSAPDRYLLAQAYQVKGDLAAAIPNLEQAAKIAPDDPGILSALAYLLQQAGRNPEALDKFRQVLKLRPDDPNTRNNLAYLIAETGGNLDEALQLAQSAVQAAPRAPSYADTVGFIFLKKKMPDAALQTLRTVVGNAPGNPTYMYHLGLAELEAGNAREARATLTAALEKKPSNSESAGIREALARITR